MYKKPIIVFEGIEGSGKSLHINNVATYLKKKGRKYIKIREPGGDRNSEKIRKLILNNTSNFDTIEIAKKNTSILDLDVWLGKKDKVQVHIKENVYETIPKSRKKYLKVEAIYEGPVQAPIVKNQVLGKIKISYKNEIIGEYDLLASEDIKKVNIFSRLINSINYLIWGDV